TITPASRAFCCSDLPGYIFTMIWGTVFLNHVVHDVATSARYSSSLTCSSQSTTLPSSASWMAMWLMPVVAVAPCQCFSPGGHTTTSPARISRLAPPQHFTQPHPEVTTNLWPSGWVCHAVRAPGSNVTSALDTRDGSTAGNSGSIRTLPVNQSVGPFIEACDPLGLISICPPLIFVHHYTVWPPSITMACPVTNAAASEHSQTTAVAISSGVPMRPTGSCAITLSRPSEVPPLKRSIIGVSMIPGHTAFTR